MSTAGWAPASFLDRQVRKLLEKAIAAYRKARETDLAALLRLGQI